MLFIPRSRFFFALLIISLICLTPLDMADSSKNKDLIFFEFIFASVVFPSPFLPDSLCSPGTEACYPPLKSLSLLPGRGIP